MSNLHKAAWVVVVLIFLFVGNLWLKEHDARLTLSIQQSQDAKTLSQLQDKEKDREAVLQSSLDSLTQLQHKISTPTQVVSALPQVIQLPAPVREVTKEQENAMANAKVPDAPKAGDLVVPQESAKAWFDSEVECKKCGVTLQSTKEQVQNLQSVVAVKDKQIDELNVALKGGTKWQRTKSALKWVAVGAAVGAVAVTVSH